MGGRVGLGGVANYWLPSSGCQVELGDWLTMEILGQERM